MVALCAAGLPWSRMGGALPPARPAPLCACPVEVAGVGVGCVTPGGGIVAGDRWTVRATGIARGRMDPARLAALAVSVDLNRATAEELASLDGIGPQLGARIVAYRRGRRFESVRQLSDVPGLGQAKVGRLTERLVVDGAPADGLH